MLDEGSYHVQTAVVVVAAVVYTVARTYCRAFVSRGFFTKCMSRITGPATTFRRPSTSYYCSAFASVNPLLAQIKMWYHNYRVALPNQRDAGALGEWCPKSKAKR